MSTTLEILILVFAYVGSAVADPEHACQNFSKGVTFNESQAVGTWYQLSAYKHNNKWRDCMKFDEVDEEQKKELLDELKTFPFIVENFKVDNIKLKMHVPCAAINSTHTQVKFEYLEKLGGDGSFRMLQLPPTEENTKLDLSKLHRYQLRFKLIEGKYLAMMDCHTKYIIVMTQNATLAEDSNISESVRKMIEVDSSSEEIKT